MTLNPSQQQQVDTFTLSQKIRALEHCRFPDRTFNRDGDFVASMVEKLAEMEEELVLSKKQKAYLDILFWKYREQHGRMRQALKRSTFTVGRDGIQGDLFFKGKPERLYNRHY